MQEVYKYLGSTCHWLKLRRSKVISFSGWVAACTRARQRDMTNLSSSLCVNACELASVIQLSHCPKRIKQCVSTLRACPYELDCSPDNHLNCHNFKYPEKFQLVKSAHSYIFIFLKLRIDLWHLQTSTY